MQSIESTDPAETFTKSGLQLSRTIIEQLQHSDPELTAKAALAIENGERLRISLTLDTAPIIELATVDDYGTAKRIGSIQMKPRAPN